jgi:hypothetical protein
VVGHLVFAEKVEVESRGRDPLHPFVKPNLT